MKSYIIVLSIRRAEECEEGEVTLLSTETLEEAESLRDRIESIIVGVELL